jgi:ABC-type multidrug transport system fused ATPase/permease subunit
MIRLIRELVRPYRGTLLIILLAMLVETAMSLATPWPLKIILDNVVSKHKMAPWLADLFHPWMDGRHQMHIAADCRCGVWVNRGASKRARRESPRDDASSPQIEEGETSRGSRWIAHT